MIFVPWTCPTPACSTGVTVGIPSGVAKFILTADCATCGAKMLLHYERR